MCHAVFNYMSNVLFARHINGEIVTALTNLFHMWETAQKGRDALTAPFDGRHDVFIFKDFQTRCNASAHQRMPCKRADVPEHRIVRK